MQKIWEESSHGNSVDGMLYNGEMCKATLMQWSRDINPNQMIDHMQKRIMELKGGTQMEAVRAEITTLLSDLERLFHDQSEYRKHCGKAAWMKDGDRNTAYFHARATIRWQVNKITGLYDASGSWFWEKQEIADG